VRQKLDAWLSDGGTVRIVPLGAFGVAALLGVIPMWLEFGTFPGWAPREKVGGPLLVAWIVIFLAAEVTRRYLGKRSASQWERQLRDNELDRADQLAGVIDRLCAAVIPRASGGLAPDHIQAMLLQGIIQIACEVVGADAALKLHASLLVPETRREGKRQVRYLKTTCMNRLAQRRGWASFKVDAKGPAQDTYRDGRSRVVPDTAAEGVRDIFTGRSFRSIVTLPVALQCVEGKRLAIVSVDASEPGIFTDAFVRERLEQAAGPYLKLIALSLTVAGRTP
jgi:hypothetical protein